MSLTAVLPRLPLTPLGRREIVLGLALALGGTAVCLVLVPPLALAPLAGGAWVLWFFRDPERTPPDDPAAILAPADGTVDDVTLVEHCAELDGPAWRIGIFLSLMSVHLNRAPADARVVAGDYRPGRHRATFRTGETDANERQITVFALLGDPELRCAVHQIAGPVARRIVWRVTPGQHVARGERFGMIKFGSRTELWLPRTPAVAVATYPGQKVRAGESVVARRRADRVLGGNRAVG